MVEIYPDTEHALLKEISRGSETAFAAIFHGYRDRVYSYSLKMLQSEETAKEVTQDVFMKLWISRIKLGGSNQPGRIYFHHRPQSLFQPAETLRPGTQGGTTPSTKLAMSTTILKKPFISTSTGGYWIKQLPPCRRDKGKYMF
jgi:hypothetical protein